MLSFYKITLFLLIGVFLVSCTEGELTGPAIVATTTTTSTTTSTTTTTTMTYGVCERSEDPRFSVQDCESPGKCHVKDIGDGYCRPSCGYLAVLVEDGKYAHYGPDDEPDTEDDPHTLSGVPCDQLDKYGATDWKKLPLVNDLEPWEVADAHIEGRTVPECCGSDQQVAKNNGEYEEEENNEEEEENIGYEGDGSVDDLDNIDI